MPPPRSPTMPCTSESPRPVPTPTSLVVKNGSKMRSRTWGARCRCRCRPQSGAHSAPRLTCRWPRPARAFDDHDVRVHGQFPAAGHGLQSIGDEVHHTNDAAAWHLQTPALSSAIARRTRTLAGRLRDGCVQRFEDHRSTCTGTRSAMPLRLKRQDAFDKGTWRADLQQGAASMPPLAAAFRCVAQGHLAVAQDGRQGCC